MSKRTLQDFDETENRWLEAYQAEDLDSALSIMLEAFEQQPENAYYCSKIGATFHSKRYLQHALLYFRHAVTLDEANPVRHYNLAQCLYRAKLYDEAIQHYLRAIVLTDEAEYESLSELYSYLGFAYLDVKNMASSGEAHAHAIRYARKRLQTQPEHPDCAQRLAYYQKHKPYPVIKKAFSLAGKGE